MPVTELAIPGLTYVPRYLTETQQAEILSKVDRETWSTDLKRRVQHYGYRYDYRRKSVDRDMFLGPLPAWGAKLAARLEREHHTPRSLNQLIVNEYLPGQGIAHHIDCKPCFADTVISLSLGSRWVLTMKPPEGPDCEVSLPLEEGSLLVLSGESRYHWTHGIPARKTDVIDGVTFPRGRRVSLTFRTVLT